MAKVLIVDDKEKNRRLFSSIFELFGNDAGIAIFEALSGKEAVDMARKEIPDLIIMDIKMETDTAGLDATQVIRQDSSIAHIPVWAVTSQAMEAYGTEESDREKCLNAGCNDYISKPFDTVKLIIKISRILKVDIPKKTKTRMGIDFID